MECVGISVMMRQHFPVNYMYYFFEGKGCEPTLPRIIYHKTIS